MRVAALLLALVSGTGCLATGVIYPVDAAVQPFRASPRAPMLTAASWRGGQPGDYPFAGGEVELARLPNLALAPIDLLAAATFNVLPVVEVLATPEAGWIVHLQSGTWQGVCGGVTVLAFDLGA